MSEFTPQYCAGCQTCGFQRDHILGYKDAQGHYLSVARAVAIINELEAKLESADRFLANQSLVAENDRLRDELRKAFTHRIHAGTSTCPTCHRFWVVTPLDDCLLPACGCYGSDTSANNSARPCMKCGWAHAEACEKMEAQS